MTMLLVACSDLHQLSQALQLYSPVYPAHDANTTSSPVPCGNSNTKNAAPAASGGAPLALPQRPGQHTPSVPSRERTARREGGAGGLSNERSERTYRIMRTHGHARASG